MQKSGWCQSGFQRDSYRSSGLSVHFRREDKEEERFDGVNRELTKTMLFTNRVMTLMMPGMMLIMYALTVAIVWVAAKKIDLGVMQVGSMTAFYHVCDADRYGIPDADNDVCYASACRCGSRPY